MPAVGVCRARGLAYAAGVEQISLFAADVAEPLLDDLGGLLAANGQLARGAAGTRLSILLGPAAGTSAAGTGAADTGSTDTDYTDEVLARADALVAECDRRGIGAQRSIEGDRVLVSTDRLPELNALADAWTRGSVKRVPEFPAPPGGFLRCWALAAGHSEPAGYLLRTDPQAEQLLPPLAAALSAIGLTGSILGSRGGGPGVRIVGRRRLRRLVELLGTAPAGLTVGAFPAVEQASR